MSACIVLAESKVTVRRSCQRTCTGQIKHAKPHAHAPCHQVCSCLPKQDASFVYLHADASNSMFRDTCLFERLCRAFYLQGHMVAHICNSPHTYQFRVYCLSSAMFSAQLVPLRPHYLAVHRHVEQRSCGAPWMPLTPGIQRSVRALGFGCELPDLVLRPAFTRRSAARPSARALPRSRRRRIRLRPFLTTRSASEWRTASSRAPRCCAHD